MSAGSAPPLRGLAPRGPPNALGDLWRRLLRRASVEGRLGIVLDAELHRLGDLGTPRWSSASGGGPRATSRAKPRPRRKRRPSGRGRASGSYHSTSRGRTCSSSPRAKAPGSRLRRSLRGHGGGPLAESALGEIRKGRPRRGRSGRRRRRWRRPWSDSLSPVRRCSATWPVSTIAIWYELRRGNWSSSALAVITAPPSERRRLIESSSLMKMIAGAFSRASRSSSRTRPHRHRRIARRSPSPRSSRRPHRSPRRAPARATSYRNRGPVEEDSAGQQRPKRLEPLRLGEKARDLTQLGDRLFVAATSGLLGLLRCVTREGDPALVRSELLAPLLIPKSPFPGGRRGSDRRRPPTRMSDGMENVPGRTSCFPNSWSIVSGTQGEGQSVAGAAELYARNTYRGPTGAVRVAVLEKQ